MRTSRFDPAQIGHRDSNISSSRPMIPLLRQRLRELALRRRHRAVLRKLRVIEGMDLPEDLKLAAVSRVMRRFEESLDRFTRSG